MIKKTRNTFFLVSIFVFFFLVTKYYFSEENIIFTNKSRSNYFLITNKDIENLPILKNDTSNIIIYKDDLEEFKKKRKKRIWEELISTKNE
tara:strand:+ start:389 stop:661 length:273 start_codon:yes stop_codon:yes gene_type:complete